jgi:hypothetical protein
MKRRNPLKAIVSRTRSHWDRDASRPAVRMAFSSVLKCGTPELGAEVFASENYELVLCHRCKSRACVSCGYRASVQWRRERYVALPEVPYKGITFTMPKELWPLFQNNPHLLKALPALAAAIIEAQAKARHNLRVGVISVLHTFNGKLEFNSHVHTLVTGGGLRGSIWVDRVYYNRDNLTDAWRRGVIRLLRSALQTAQLHSCVSCDELDALLASKEECWWSVKIQSFQSKLHFLRYAGRYARRPPISQRRIIAVGTRSVTFWYKDKKLGRRVHIECSLEEFIDRWAQHIPERYQHSARNFGLFSPRSLRKNAAAIFAILRQLQRSRPKPLKWADSIKRDFGYDPSVDPSGKKMRWARRLAPRLSG